MSETPESPAAPAPEPAAPAPEAAAASAPAAEPVDDAEAQEGAEDGSEDPQVSEGGIRAKRPARRRRRQRDRFFSRRKVSRLTTDPGLAVDYKNISLLRTFLSPEGKILPRRITGNTAKQQRQVAEAVKRARHLALLPYEPPEH